MCVPYLILALSLSSPEFPETLPPHEAEVIIDPCTSLVIGVSHRTDVPKQVEGTIDRNGIIYLIDETTIYAYKAVKEIK